LSKIKKNILIFGASGHSSVIIDIIEKTTDYHIIGYIDNDINKQNSEFLGYKILGTQKDLISICKKYQVSKGLIAIGNNWIRELVSDLIEKEYSNFEFISIIHPSAQIAKRVKIDKGSVVMAGVVINSNVEIGKHCIINSSSVIEHNCVIKDFSSLAPGVIIGGSVNIGKSTAISIGAVIKNNINIGNCTVIGAGATVLNNINDCVVAYGTPAKFIRNRTKDEEYLR